MRPVSPSQVREDLSLSLLSHREFTSTTWILRMERKPKNNAEKTPSSDTDKNRETRAERKVSQQKKEKQL